MIFNNKGEIKVTHSGGSISETDPVWLADKPDYLTIVGAASAYQPLDSDLTAIAALTGSSGFLKTNGAGTWSVDTQIITSGTYTPTATTVVNLSSVTPTVAQYLRVGNTVTVSGEFTATTSAASGTLTRFRITLPIASNIAQTYQCNGTAYCGTVSSLALGAAIIGDATNDQAEFKWGATAAATLTYSYSFTYQII